MDIYYPRYYLNCEKWIKQAVLLFFKVFYSETAVKLRLLDMKREMLHSVQESCIPGRLTLCILISQILIY